MKVTLDTNCIIALEENRPAALFVRQLISLRDAKTISLQIPAISASERKSGGIYPTNFNEFEQKIAAVGLGHIEILPTLAYAGMAFPDRCYPAGGEATILEKKIHDVLFPNTSFDSPKWNQKCDVLALWCHIHFNGDIFVTSDNEFRKAGRKDQLITLGARDILSPQDAVLSIQAKIKERNTIIKVQPY